MDSRSISLVLSEVQILPRALMVFMNLKRIAELEKICAGTRIGFEAPMYLYGTEMISGYYSRIGLKNKKVLTVAGSGDPIINACFYGAKEVIGFDINTLSQFICDLKWQAVKTFSYNEFLDFFGSEKKQGSFNYNKYCMVRKKLGVKARQFFDALYEYFKFKGKKIRNSVFLHKRSYTYAVIPPLKVNSYLRNEKNYLKARKELNKAKLIFIRADITKIASKKELKGTKFDVINLSNVPNYFVNALNKQGTNDPVMKLFNILLELKTKLGKKGLIFFYRYSEQNYPNDVTKEIPLMARKKSLKRIKERKKFNYSEIKFAGIQKGLDRIIMLKNK